MGAAAVTITDFFLRSLTIEAWMAQILGLVFIVALLSARPHSLANRLLAGGLLCAVYRQFLIALRLAGTIDSFPSLIRTSFPAQMLAIPAFYLYVKALTTPDFKLKRKDAVHLLPMSIGLAWWVTFWIWGDTLLQSGLSQDWERYLRVIVKVLVVVPYLVLSSKQVAHFAREVVEHTSEVGDLRLGWLHRLLFVAYAALAIDILDVATGPSIQLWYVVPAVALISLILLASFSLRVSPVFAREIQSQSHEVQDSAVTIPVVSTPKEEDKPRLSDDELNRQKDRLTGVVENQTLYLNPELRLSDLATALGMRPYRVSEVLNRGMHTSFYDLINRYRVAKAQQLLCSPGAAHLNLLGIAMESGFKSKSVFNEVFKKSTGLTPSQFRSARMSGSSNSDNRIASSGR